MREICDARKDDHENKFAQLTPALSHALSALPPFRRAVPPRGGARPQAAGPDRAAAVCVPGTPRQTAVPETQGEYASTVRKQRNSHPRIVLRRGNRALWEMDGPRDGLQGSKIIHGRESSFK